MESTLSSRHPGSRDLMPDPEESAQRAGLRYVNDDEPGIRRKKWGRGFTYLDPEGNHITNGDVRERLEDLSIPPAWTDVWICPHENGHLQATGRDDEGRKQYLYHPDWKEVRSRAKFERLIPFGEALPQIRARCMQDLHRDGLPREKVLAAAVRLLDCTLIRIGHSQYSEENDSYGLTTLRNRHVSFTSDSCTFEYTGKGGKQHHIELDDPSLSKVVEQCEREPGGELFQYYDQEDHRHSVDSENVNSYLQTSANLPVTAKDFRTWGGTLAAAVTLVEVGPSESEQEAQQNVRSMIEEVADQLGNTKSVCRDHYIHPDLIYAYEEGVLIPKWTNYAEESPPPHLAPEEHATLQFLREES